MEIIKKFDVTLEDMANLLVCAFEGGINYWCDKVEMKKDPAGIGFDGVTLEDDEQVVYASDLIGLGGTLILHDAESSDTWELTQEKMLQGISKGMEWGKFSSVEEMMDNHDAETADVIVQFALFGELQFG
jgi:hypothetical protein